MSDFNEIENLWKSADIKILAAESLDSETVKQAITKQSIGITFNLLKSIRAGILVLTISVAVFTYNIYGYAGNSLISLFSIISLILSILLLPYLFYQYSSINKIDQSDLSLENLIVAKIKYFKMSLPLVRHAIAMGFVLMTLSINLLTDNNKGHFQINNTWLFLGLMIIAYVLIVIMFNLIHNLYLKQYRTALIDLNESKLTEMAAELRKHKWMRLLFLVITLLGVIAGIIIFFLKTTGN
ncbi:MAG: hypothetical protein OEQ53_10155 [Saprospiraceae bacterium]|nr:hypothetical protein [Saprospiraceae bacterium]